MSNKRTFEKITDSQARKASIETLSDRPNKTSHFGEGGLSAQQLKQRFDALPELSRKKINEIIAAFNTVEGAKYIGIDAADQDNLYDFLALFKAAERNGKNIADYIEMLYEPIVGGKETSTSIKDIINEVCSELISDRAVLDEINVRSNENKNSIEALSDTVNEVNSRVDEDFSKQEERIIGIERYLGGENFVIDDTTAYEKKVPSNACEKAKILSIGGMTYKDKEGKRLVHAKVTSLLSKGINLWDSDVTDVNAPGWVNKDTPKAFSENVWYQGLTSTSYWDSRNVSNVQLSNNKVSFYTTNGGYGMARAFKCKPNTAYVLSFDYEGDFPSGCSVGFYDASGNWLNYDWDGKDIVTPANCYWLTVTLVSVDYPSNCTFSNIMFAESDIELPYTPYVGAIGYLPIPQSLLNGSTWGVGTADVYNKIYFVEGKAFYSAPAKSYEFTGDEDLGEWESTDDFFRCVSNGLDDAIQNTQKAVCSHFEYGDTANTFDISSGARRFSFRFSYDFFKNGESTTADRIEAIRNWLRAEKTNGTPVTVVYPLENPPADTDISPIMSRGNIIQVVKNGYMVANSNAEKPVPFGIKYLVTYQREDA